MLTGQDKGFWTGVASLMETSKRPIILCCNGTRFFVLIAQENPLNGCNQSIPPTLLSFLNEALEVVQVEQELNNDESACYVQLVLLCEGFYVSPKQVKTLVSSFNGDIRKALAFFQTLTRRSKDPEILLCDDAFSLVVLDDVLGSQEKSFWGKFGRQGDDLEELESAYRYTNLQSMTNRRMSRYSQV